MFPFNGGGKGYGLGLNTYGCLINVQVNTTAPIALYTASPYYYNAGYNRMYSGSYSAVTDWKVTVTADGMDLSMTYLDEDNDNRVCANTATAYTSRAIPVRCIKE